MEYTGDTEENTLFTRLIHRIGNGRLTAARRSFKLVTGKTLRKGSPAMVLRCSEPALGTSDAVRRFEEFIKPTLRSHGIPVGEGILFDTVALPGVIRRIANADKAFAMIMRRAVGLLVDAHNIEVIFLLEHVYCAERADAAGRKLTAQEERKQITRNLNEAEAFLRGMYPDWETGPQVVPCVALVTPAGDSSRRCVNVLELGEYLSQTSALAA